MAQKCKDDNQNFKHIAQLWNAVHKAQCGKLSFRPELR